MTRRTTRRRRPTISPPYSPHEPIPVDVADRGDEYLVQADLPGLRTQDIGVRVKTNRVQISADFGDAPDQTRRRERPVGEVSRTIHLPEKVDERRVTADYQDGVLSVTLEKRNPGHRIEIA